MHFVDMGDCTADGPRGGKTKHSTPGPAFDALERDAEAARRATVVIAALDLGIFEIIENTRDAAPDNLAAALGVEPFRLAPLLEALVGLGYLLRAPSGALGVHPSAAEFLLPESPGYRGRELARWTRTLRGWSWLAEVIRRDQPRYVGSLESKGTPSAPTHMSLAARGHRLGLQLLGTLDLGAPGAVLDLGSGIGGYARAFLDTFPQATVTLFDRPDVVRLAGEQPSLQRYGDRVGFVAGDLLEEIPRGPFDVVFLGNVLHLFEPPVAADIVARAASALTPEGRLVVRDSMVDAGRDGPPAALLFGVHMAVFAHYCRLPSTGEVEAMVARAGLRHCLTQRTEPGGEAAVVVGQRVDRR